MTKNDKKNYRNRMIGEHKLHPETLMMSYGYDPQLSEGAIKPPLFQTSTFAFKNAEAGKAFFEIQTGKRQLGADESAGLIYSRFNNPNVEILENRLALWDDAEDAAVFASGMAAISTIILAFARPGDVVVYSKPIYGGTDTLIQNFFSQLGIQSVGLTIPCTTEVLQKTLKQAASLGPVAVILLETPANPTNGLIDIAECRKLADALDNHGKRPLIAVDNTLLGPLWQHPLKHGADLSLYSLTKYVGGHSDIVAGSCAGSRVLVSQVRKLRSALGMNSDSHSCWLLMRSLETLKLRMTAASEGARKVAEYLRGHAQVERVHYLGFLEKNDPQYATFQRQCLSPGSTFSFNVKGGETEAFQLLDSLQIIKLAVSLGGTETLISHPAAMTHSGIPADVRQAIGVTPNLLRISVGIENPEDLIADLEQGLRAMSAPSLKKTAAR
ncbi:MAG: cystathionine gamma-synthase family protein [Pseudomonadota bacterium]